MTDFFFAVIITMIAAFILEPTVLGLMRFFGFYAIVREREARVTFSSEKFSVYSRSRGFTFFGSASG